MKTCRNEFPGNGTVISGQIIVKLSTATAALCAVLYGSGADSRAAADTSLSISLSALTLAFSEIAQVQKVIQTANTVGPEQAPALAEYQYLLREFKSNLPRFQGWLLAERARLARRGSHSTAVESWVETNLQTCKLDMHSHKKH